MKAEDFIFPYFVVEGTGVKSEISSMPGIYRFSIDTLVDDVKEVYKLGINKVLLFGVIEDKLKDERGSLAYTEDALVCRAVKAIKKAVPEIELEAFIHGAMCMTYSGRCLLGDYL